MAIVDIIIIILGVLHLFAPDLIWVIFTRRVDEKPGRIWRLATRIIGIVVIIYYLNMVVTNL